MKKTLYLSDAAITSLSQHQSQLKKRGIRVSDSELVSQAVVQYVLAENESYAEERIERIIDQHLQKGWNRIAAMIASATIDIDMILSHVLQERLEIFEDVDQKQIYDDLRESGQGLFKLKRSFQLGALMDSK